MANSGAIEVAPRGDVLLICGQPDQATATQTRIQVSSHALTMCSPVFRSMLGPHFKEGNVLATSSSIELPLLEDDPKAMLILCHALHLRNKEILSIPETMQILDVAKLVDKYDCTEAMVLSADRWINVHLDRAPTDTKARCTLLLAAYYFQHSPLVERVAYQLIAKSTMEIQIPDHLIHFDLPETIGRLFNVLETKRVFTLKQAAAVIEDCMVFEHDLRGRFPGVATCASSCIYGEMRFGHLVRELRSKNLWPATKLESIGVGSAFEAMQNIECTAPSVGPCVASFYNHRCVAHCLLSSAPYAESCAKIKAKAKELEVDVANICYDCAMTGEVKSIPFCSHGQSKYRTPEFDTDNG